MNERIAAILKNPWTIPVAVGVTSFGSGLGLGYILGRRRTTSVFEVEEEQDQLEFDFDTEGLARVRTIIDEEAYRSPIMAPQSDANVVNDMVVVPVFSEEDIPEDEPKVEIIELVEEEPEELLTVNVFENSNDDWDWEKEVEGRDITKPYILHRDEFYRDEMDFTQTTLTYYVSDDLMVDEEQQLVPRYQTITGPLMWGHGSGDPNVLYVRNEERRGEYEILRDTGSYAEDVLGLEAEANAKASDLRHSRNLRFRDE